MTKERKLYILGHILVLIRRFILKMLEKIQTKSEQLARFNDYLRGKEHEYASKSAKGEPVDQDYLKKLNATIKRVEAKHAVCKDAIDALVQLADLYDARVKLEPQLREAQGNDQVYGVLSEQAKQLEGRFTTVYAYMLSDNSPLDSDEKTAVRQKYNSLRQVIKPTRRDDLKRADLSNLVN